MLVPFKLKVKNNLEVDVEIAEIKHIKGPAERGGMTWLSYYIKQGDKGRIYTGIAQCSKRDNFARRFGRRMAELRAIDNYRVRNGLEGLSHDAMVAIVENELNIRILKGKLKNFKVTEYNQDRKLELERQLTAREEFLERIWE